MPGGGSMPGVAQNAPPPDSRPALASGSFLLLLSSVAFPAPVLSAVVAGGWAHPGGGPWGGGQDASGE
ncbi:hypothetical protein, partial [Arthrobacter wenxiniae]|uniref:hypothetical protein n=1 Tax=Arthrobacter wenxiniae TaxID=2713570 RepID=UPI001C400484